RWAGPDQPSRARGERGVGPARRPERADGPRDLRCYAAVRGRGMARNRRNEDAMTDAVRTRDPLATMNGGPAMARMEHTLKELHVLLSRIERHSMEVSGGLMPTHVVIDEASKLALENM